MTRRQKSIKITDALMTKMLQDVYSEMPEDLRVLGARWHPFKGTVEFLISSSEFPELPEGCEPEAII